MPLPELPPSYSEVVSGKRDPPPPYPHHPHHHHPGLQQLSVHTLLRPAWPAPAPAPGHLASLGPAYSSRAGRGHPLTSSSRPGPVVGALQLVVLLTIVTIILVKLW